MKNNYIFFLFSSFNSLYLSFYLSFPFSSLVRFSALWDGKKTPFWSSANFARSVLKNSGYIYYSSSLRPGTKGFARGKWIIGYNLGIDDATESKFGILKYEYCDVSRDHFAKSGLRKEIKQ